MTQDDEAILKTVRRVLWLVALLSLNLGIGIGLLIAKWTQ